MVQQDQAVSCIYIVTVTFNEIYSVIAPTLCIV
jgi:hypothetical protein